MNLELSPHGLQGLPGARSPHSTYGDYAGPGDVHSLGSQQQQSVFGQFGASGLSVSGDLPRRPVAFGYPGYEQSWPTWPMHDVMACQSGQGAGPGQGKARMLLCVQRNKQASCV
jgi:hypothetical protein